MKRTKNFLLIIDPQNDFCDPSGSLYVNGASEDMTRLGNWIRSHKGDLTKIVVTLDSHPVFGIEHPPFWMNADGTPTPAWTEISHDDIKAGKYRPAKPSLFNYSLEYTQKLEAKGNYKLFVWPSHCIIGTWGHNVYKPVMDALLDWSGDKRNNPTFVTKGTNPFTEHYGAVEAEVPQDNDPATQTNMAFIQDLQEADRIYVAGEASSHCLATTVEGLRRLGISTDKLVLLTDGMSPVGLPVFQAKADEFLRRSQADGITLRTTMDPLL